MDHQAESVRTIGHFDPLMAVMGGKSDDGD
jgi:hypothetical protein